MERRPNVDGEVGAIARGDLRAMSLSSLIQSNCAERSRARLLLIRGDEEGTLFFADGDVVHARLGALVGEEAVYELLRWESGEFELEMGATASERSVALGGPALLLEALRRLDESATEWEPDLDGAAPAVSRANTDLHVRIAKALKEISGVQGVIICARDGGVLAQAGDGDQSEEAALAGFVGHRAETLSAHLMGGPLQRVVLSGGSRLTTMVRYGQNLIVVITGERVPVDSLADEIQTVLRRYGAGDG